MIADEPEFYEKLGYKLVSPFLPRNDKRSSNLAYNERILKTKSLHNRVRTWKQNIVHIALVVKDYDEAIDFYVNKLNFELIEDTYQAEQDKRCKVVVAPPNSHGVTLLLAKAS